MILDSLIVEVTRKCNMACDHCLRGDAQNLNIDHSYITTLLENVSSVSSLTFTGGEPSLNVKAIRFTLEELKRLNIDVCSFYIATNGSKTSMSKGFTDICCDLYRYQEDKEDCGKYMLEMSDDYYHDQDLHRQVTEHLGIYTFFRLRKNDYSRSGSLINQGRWQDGRELIVPEHLSVDFENYDGEPRIESDLYLNTKGLITTCCDMSYENQDANFVCHVSEIMDHLEDLKVELGIEMAS